MNWFENVYKSYYKDIYKYIYILCMDNNIVEDIAQEVFTLCYRKQHNLTDHPCIKAWLYTTARNKTWEHLKKRKLKIKYEFELSAQALIDTYHVDIVPYETYEMLNYFLTDEEIEILKLHSEYGFTIKEISESKNLRYSTFRQRYLRMRKKIRAALKNTMLFCLIIPVIKGVLKWLIKI